MDELRNLKLFSTLTKVERAKLIPLATIVNLPEGGHVDSETDENEFVYFVAEGWGELITFQDGTPVSLLTLSTGDGVGRLVPGMPKGISQIRSRSSMVLVRFRSEHFHSICRQNPLVGDEVMRWLSSRLLAAEFELARTKRMLATYSAELWYQQESANQPSSVLAETAAAEEASFVPRIPSGDGRLRLHRMNPWKVKVLKTITMFALLVGIHLWVQSTTATPATAVLAILGWGALNWYLGIIPDYAVALSMVASAAALALAPFSTALSGFTNSAYFLLLGIYGLGAAIQKTGLLYRFALYMLRRLPPTYGGQMFALVLTGVLLTPILPSANGRVTIASPLVQELSEAMRLPHRSPGSSGLLLASLHGFGQMYFLFMSGGTCLLLWGLLPEPYRSDITWLRWLLLAFPLGLLIFAGFVAALYWLPGARHIPPISRDMLNTQMATLGELSSPEILTLTLTGFVFVTFATQPLHGIDSAWPAVIGLVLLLAVGIVDRSAFLQRIDWTYLIFFGSVVSYAELIRYVKLDAGLGQVIQTVLAPTVGLPPLFLASIVLLTYLVRVVVPWSATVPLLILAITPVMIANGYHPFIGGLVMLAASNPFFLPHQNLLFLNAHSGTDEKAISLKTAAHYGWVQAGVVLGAVLVTIPIWKMFGWVP